MGRIDTVFREAILGGGVSGVAGAVVTTSMALAYDFVHWGTMHIDFVWLYSFARMGLILGTFLGITVGAVGAWLQTTGPVETQSLGDWLRDLRAGRGSVAQAAGPP
jgi:hypothetical protein